MQIIDPQKFLNPEEVKALRKYLSTQAKHGGQRAKLRWMAIDLLLSTGLRCFEACELQVEDCHIGYGENYIFVRRGKGGKPGAVIISEKFKKHIKQFIGDRSSGYLLLSERGQSFTRRGLQMLVKRAFKDCGLPSHYSIHSCRHSFCSALYAATQDLRLTQQQARHASPNTTMTYTHLLDEKIKKGMEGLYE